MSTLDVVADVLREIAPRALKARQIAELAGDRLPTASRTPETVVSRDLAIDVRDRGAASRFLRVDRGAFVLKEALPTAFYNDVDPYVAKWTRNLIEAGHLAPGVVDERSIRDLKPADVASYRQCHFFAGVGTWSRVLRDAGWPDDIHIWSGSCPCQDFSSAGKRRGFNGDLHLWPEWFRLIAACRPAVVVGEQVASKAGRAWLDLVLADLEGAGYTCRAFDLPAASVGGPHARQRLYFVAYSGERGREVVGASWLHDRGQRGDDVARCGEAHGRVSCAVPDAAVARPCASQDAGADRGDASSRSEAIDGGSAGHLESERGGDADGAGAVPHTERVVWDAGRACGSHGRPAIEPDRHGEAHGVVLGTDGLGDTGFAGSGRDTGEVRGAQGVGAGGWLEAGALAHESSASSTADGGSESGASDGLAVEVVRGAVGSAGDTPSFRPGDRIRLGDDPTWGGAVGGFWAEDVEWIYCRPEPGHQNGRWRPARAGIEPLADGPSPGMGRTRAKRLRGFGNAIVRPLAVAFIESVIEAFVDAARSLGLSPAAQPSVVEARDPAISSAPETVIEVMEAPLVEVVEAPLVEVVEESAA